MSKRWRLERTTTRSIGDEYSKFYYGKWQFLSFQDMQKINDHIAEMIEGTFELEESKNGVHATLDNNKGDATSIMLTLPLGPFGEGPSWRTSLTTSFLYGFDDAKEWRELMPNAPSPTQFAAALRRLATEIEARFADKKENGET